MQYPLYKAFCESLSIEPLLEMDEVSRHGSLINQFENEHLTALLFAFVDCVADEENEINVVDQPALDSFIQKIDSSLGQQLDEILHHPEFQSIEATWRELLFFIHRIDSCKNVQVEILNISESALKKDFDLSSDITKSGLYQQIAVNDSSEKEPITAIISGYEFTSSLDDVALLKNISKIASAFRCPFISSVGAEFFGKETFEDVLKIHELSHYMRRGDFDCWNEFRASEESHYVGLTCPKFLLRTPYRLTHAERFISYNEDVYNNHHQYLWGSSSFIFAINLAKTYQSDFSKRVDRLSFQHNCFDDGACSEMHEIANLGFIPISCRRNCDVTFFFLKNSAHDPKRCKDSQIADNLRIKSLLSYVFIRSRIAHYLKILQCEIIRINVNRDMLEAGLNCWLKNLIEKFCYSDSSHSLKGSKIEVQSFDKSAGFCQIILHLSSDLHYEGEVISLSPEIHL